MEHVASVRDEAHGLDVIGLGALNVDLITPVSTDHDRPNEDAEKPVTRRDIAGWLTAEKQVPHAFLGGSAFNAMVMLAQLGTGLRLGMIGISATPPEGLIASHGERLADLDVADLTSSSQRHPGLCLALSTEHSRRLYTAPEANLEIADYLVRHDRPGLAVKTARVLHLTSLLEDPNIPDSNEVTKSVASFVEMAKFENPDLLLSLDPGTAWIERLNELPELRGIYALADVLYINPQEHAELSGGQSGTLVGLCSRSTLVIVKTRHGVTIQRSDGSEVGRALLQDDGVAVDPTGAGDAVAAGVLAAVGCRRSPIEGCRLGLRIAAQRVSDIGDRGHVDLRGALGQLWP